MLVLFWSFIVTVYCGVSNGQTTLAVTLFLGFSVGVIQLSILHPGDPGVTGPDPKAPGVTNLGRRHLPRHHLRRLHTAGEEPSRKATKELRLHLSFDIEVHPGNHTCVWSVENKGKGKGCLRAKVFIR